MPTLNQWVLIDATNQAQVQNARQCFEASKRAVQNKRHLTIGGFVTLIYYSIYSKSYALVIVLNSKNNVNKLAHYYHTVTIFVLRGMM